jgi:hypothetical protein
VSREQAGQPASAGKPDAVLEYSVNREQPPGDHGSSLLPGQSVQTRQPSGRVLLSLPLDGCATALTTSTLPGLTVTVTLLRMLVKLAELMISIEAMVASHGSL